MSTLRRSRTLLTITLLVLGSVRGARAQTAVGEVLDALTQRPLRGAFVRLHGPGAPASAAALTDSLGSFAIRTAVSGTYRVTVDLVGYAPLALDSVELVAGSATRLTLGLTPQALRLQQIAATAKVQCQVRPESGAGTQAVWAQVRRALDVTAWGARSNQLRYVVATFQRTLERSGRVSARLRPDSAIGTGPQPFTTLSVEELTGRGFITPGKAPDEYVFHAPDAEVLLSDAFLATHCFWVQAGPKEHRDWVGLAFEPTPGRLLPDIAGVLWAERATGELKQLDYQYTRLPWDLPDGLASGRVAFRRTPAGAWIIQNWIIRIPRVQAAPPAVGRLAEHRRYQLVGFDEAGGDVRDLRTPEGLRIPGERTAAALGMVFDSTNTAPLAGARVVVEGTSIEAFTDLAGRYQLEDVSAGEHEITVEHPRLDALGVRLSASGVTFTPGTWSRRDFAVPSLSTVWGARCDRQGVIAGTVRDTLNGGNVAGARVVASWRSDSAVAVADTAGQYLLCGIPADAAVRLTASRWEWERSTVDVRLGERAGMQIDVPLARLGPAVLTGRVRDSSSGVALAGAQVELEGLRAVADSAGRFRLIDVPPGHHQLRVSFLGRGTYTDTLTLPAGGSADIQVELAESAIRLRPIEVRARAQLVPALEAVRQRQQEMQKVGLGQFVWRKDFEKQSPRRLTDVLRGIRGILLVPATDERRVGQYIVRTTRNLRLTLNPCRVQLYMDGVRLTATSGPDEPFDLMVPISTIEAIEVYTTPAEVPPEFGGSNFGCGVVAVWTRRTTDR